MTITTRTPEEAQAWLERHGITVIDFARSHGFQPNTVYSLLKKRTSGRTGEAYRAAIALGLRSPPPAGEEPPISK